MSSASGTRSKFQLDSERFGSSGTGGILRGKAADVNSGAFAQREKTLTRIMGEKRKAKKRESGNQF
jgi:hypothetical protein